MTAGLLALVVLGVAALLTAVGLRWAGWRKRDRDPVTLPFPRGPHHLHYCTACDKQWEHAGTSHECTKSWATRCPACAPA